MYRGLRDVGLDVPDEPCLALLCVASQPGVRVRELAACVGVTERAAHRLLCELEAAGYLTKHKLGRRNFYEIDASAPLRHPLERHVSVGDLLRPLGERPAVLGRDAPLAR